MEGLVLILLVLVGLPWIAVQMYRAGRTQEPERAVENDASLAGGDAFFQEVVGEASYQPALRAAVVRLGSAPVIVSAIAQPEADNQFDENAVSVMVDGRVVGYLPRASAKRYRKLYGTSPVSCRGRIVGGERGKHYGIWLDLELRRSRSG